jgi:hypothetical protein
MNYPVASAGQQGCDDHAHADEHINENVEAAWRQVHRHAPDRCGSEGADHAELSALMKPNDKK